jgi:hypothetical protein
LYVRAMRAVFPGVEVTGHVCYPPENEPRPRRKPLSGPVD